MIEVRDVHKVFGQTRALKGLDLVVERGEVVALLGPNGAGKTTLVRILTTLLRPERGAASVAGFDTVRDAASLRQVIGLSGQFAAIDDLLTGRENLELIGSLHHFGRAEARRCAESALERFSLREAADRQAKTYSGGMRRRLDLALSLIARPPVLVLDEPTTGLDPRTRVDFWLLIEELVAEGTTLLLTTQYMEEADRLAHRIAVIDHGRTITGGTPDQLKARVGGDTVELLVADQTDFDKALAATAPLRDGTATVDRRRRRVALPAPGGATTLMSALRRLDEAGVVVDDIGLRRPSLDDVFVALTGHTANGTGDSRHANPHPENGRSTWSTTSAGGTGAGDSGSGSTWRSTLTDIALITVRDLRRVVRTPRALYLSLVQPVVVALLFLYVLGGAINTPGLSYVNYLIPGVAIQTTLFGATTAVAIAVDLQGGMIDRFRSLPIARSAVLAGQTLTDLVRTTLALCVLFGVSVLLGFGFHNGFWWGLAAFILILVFSFAMSWLLVLIGLVAKDPETAHLANMLPFPLVFVGSAYVPVETMPDWLQTFAGNQPFSVVINAVRAMTQGGDVHHWLSLSIAWIVAMLLLFIPLSVSYYRKLWPVRGSQ
jgi:ABC-2 type transport system ATP-binding protein